MVDETPGDDFPVVEPPTGHEALIKEVRDALGDDPETEPSAKTKQER